MMSLIWPECRWIASNINNRHLWPMLDVSNSPLDTLPHDELLAKLKSLTNLRVLPRPESDTGWRIEIGPFPDCTDVPAS